MSDGLRWTLLVYAAIGAVLALVGTPTAVRYVAGVASRRVNERLTDEEKKAVGPRAVKAATMLIECVAPFLGVLLLAAAWPWLVGVGVRQAVLAKRGGK